MSADLRTRYLGLNLAHPVVVGACSLGYNLDNLKRMEDAGAAAVVLPSLFEEQIEHEQVDVARFYDRGAESFAEAIDYFPELGDYTTTSDKYLELVASARRSLSIPVIASLNGTSLGGWIDYARMIQDAGAHALELNIYDVVTDPETTAAAVESRYLELARAVRDSVGVPLAVKMGPFFSSLPNMARRLEGCGVGGLVLFNRFLQPDIDLETLDVQPRLVLSTSDELRLSLRWIAILRGQLHCSLAATSGIHTPEDLIKPLLAGADAVMIASALYRKGIHHLRTLVDGLRDWLDAKEYDSVRQMEGSLCRANAPDPSVFERANYIKTLVSHSGFGATT